MRRLAPVLALLACLVFSGSACAGSRGRLWMHPGTHATQISFGALTPVGMGDIAVPGTIVTEVDAAGAPATNLAVSGGTMTVASLLTSSSYTVLMSTGQRYAVSVIPNAYSIGKASDFNGASNTGVGKLMYVTPGILNGKRIIGRPGLTMAFQMDGGFGSPLRNQNFGDAGTGWAGLTVESEDPTRPWTATDNIDITSRYITFRGIRGTIPVVAGNSGAWAVLDGNNGFPVTDIVFDSVQIIGATKDVNSNIYASDVDGSIWGNGRAISDNGNNYVSNIRVIGSTIMYPYRGIVLPSRAPIDGVAGNLVSQSLHIAGNYMAGIYEHGLGLSYTGTDTYVRIEDNVFDGIVGVGSDGGGPPNGPHPDLIFIQANAFATTDMHVDVFRNWFFKKGRGAASVSFRNMPAGHNFIVNAIGNVMIQGSGEGFNIVDARNSVALYNIILSDETTDSALKGVINYGIGGWATNNGTHRLTGNIVETLSISGTPTLSGNVLMGDNETTIPFSSVFVGARPFTRAAALSALVTKGAYAAAGPLGTANPVNYPAANPSNVLGSNNVN